ncbi:hypothetical protein [Stutzerimonas nitrititolerans]|uniref:hypothetical protein n=1 Tax=Stutzerimonas nitrititolerans TaxID=2482751 RepID=UPI0028979CC0|nr:hypothetical protein [Stutzerimonas nitrititolerans]
MKWKLALPTLSLSLLIAGCQATAPTATSDSSNGKTAKAECGFYQTDQPEYELTQLAKQYVTNSVRSTPNGSFDPQFRNKNYFKPVIENTFKFSLDTQKQNLYNELQKDDIFELDNQPYVYSGYEMVKIVTSTCQVFWYERGNFASITLENVKRADGRELSLNDYKFILGEKNLKPFHIPPAKIEHDKFKNTIKITGLYDNSMMFRAWGSTKTGKLNDSNVQLYADVKFLENWAHLEHAYDEDANQRDLVKIDKDANCSNKYLGCQLTETVGIEIPISYLKTKPNGFELKVSGKQERILKIASYQIKQILDAIKSLE